MKFPRYQINTLPDAKAEISRLRKKLYTTEDLQRKLLSASWSPMTVAYLEQIIVKNPDYERTLLRIAESQPKPIRHQIHTIINNAKANNGE